MASKLLPKCLECGKMQAAMWRHTDEGQVCSECYEQNAKPNTEGDNGESSNGGSPAVATNSKDKEGNIITDDKKLRKSTRATRFKTKAGVPSNTPGNNSSNSLKTVSKGRNRRNIFKKTPFKTPLIQATTHIVDSIFYKGLYFQIGDIVSVIDAEENIYYAQIRGLLVDTYCEKSAFLTWLIPTQASPPPNEGFDASTYLIGPDEEQSRRLSCLEFIMHAPSNYYHDKTTPFPLPDSMDYDTKPGGFIWTSLSEFERSKNS